jgi:hypothetical protein
VKVYILLHVHLLVLSSKLIQSSYESLTLYFGLSRVKIVRQHGSVNCYFFILFQHGKGS